MNGHHDLRRDRRVLVAEPLAERGLDAMRDAGLEVDERLGLSPAELLAAVPGAAALVIRSATQVTAEVLEAGTDLVVVGRAGIGLDNVDVAAATQRGVMVVNAPQSNVLSAAEHTMALMLAQARNVPQAARDLKAGEWNRSRGTVSSSTARRSGIVGLGRVGVLVAQRALAFGMQLVAYDPYVSADRARQLGVQLVADARRAHGGRRLPHRAPPEDARDDRADRPRRPAQGEADAPDRQHRPRRHRRRGGARRRGARGPDRRRRARRVRRRSRRPRARSSSCRRVVVTPHLGASTAEAQDKAGQTIAEQVVLALRGEFVPFAVNVAANEANATVQPFLPLAERLGRLFTALAGGVVDVLEVSYEGAIGDYDCKVLTLAVLKGVLAPVVDVPVSFVNAPQIAEERGLTVRETTSGAARDYVNLVTLRGRIAGRAVHVAGTLTGTQELPRIVGIDDHLVDLPPTRHMLVVHNDDRPGMIGTVGTVLGEAGINISDMDVGRGPDGDAALDGAVARRGRPARRDRRRSPRRPGILLAQPIELGLTRRRWSTPALRLDRSPVDVPRSPPALRLRLLDGRRRLCASIAHPLTSRGHLRRSASVSSMVDAGSAPRSLTR